MGRRPSVAGYRPEDEPTQEKQSGQQPKAKTEHSLKSEREYLARINKQLVILDEMSMELKQQTKQMRTISRRTDIIAFIILLFFISAVLYSFAGAILSLF